MSPRSGPLVGSSTACRLHHLPEAGAAVAFPGRSLTGNFLPSRPSFLLGIFWDFLTNKLLAPKSWTQSISGGTQPETQMDSADPFCLLWIIFSVPCFDFLTLLDA